MAEDPQQSRFSSQYSDALNLAQRQFALESGCCIKDMATITVVAATAAYSLPLDFLRARLVMHKGLPLEPITKADLAYNNKGDRWDDNTGTPEYYNIETREDKKYLTLYPIPTADDAGANLVLTYRYVPSDFSSDADTVFDGESMLGSYENAVAIYAAWWLLGYNRQDVETIQKRSIMFKQYQDKVTEAVEKFGDTKNAKMRIRGGRSWL